MNSRALAVIEVLRPLNVVIMMLVIAAAIVLAGGTADDWMVIVIAATVGGMVGGAANAINDYFDVEIDRINKPNRPLPRGAVRPELVPRLWLVLSAVGISLNLFLNSRAFWIAAGAVIILFFYSARWKRRVLIGNVAVALMTAMAFVYGATVIDRPERAVLPALFAFLLNLGREIIKDVEDVQGDTLGHAVTFPVKYGVRRAFVLASAVLGMLIVTTLVAYALGPYNDAYLWIIVVVDILLAYVVVSMWKNPTTRNLGSLSLILKANMLIGLVALYLGS